MIRYKSIGYDITWGAFHLFPKLDGSNVRAEWTLKKGLHKFGKRNALLGKGDFLYPSVALMREQETVIADLCKRAGWKKATFFFEYLGDNSFAGSHVDDDMSIYLIDIHAHRKGFIEVELYLELTQELDIACPYIGLRHTRSFVSKVKNGLLPGQSFEGVVAKRDTNKGRQQFKVKNKAWIAKLEAVRKRQ